MCTNASTDNECQYLTQETSCIGPAPFKCQCSTGKYFNKEKDHYKCETLLELNQSCLQGDSCRNAYCIGTPLKCRCLPFQYFDPMSSQCQNPLNASSSTMITWLSNIITSSSPTSSKTMEITTSLTTTSTVTTESSLTTLLTTTTSSCSGIQGWSRFSYLF